MRGPVLAAALVLLAACEASVPPTPEATETGIPERIQQSARPAIPVGEEAVGTPMAERVAVLGLLNKRNNITQDIEMTPGQTRRFGDVIVRLSACEKTAPWEVPKESGAFVQVFVKERPTQEGFGKVFSGWLFKNSPSLNVVEHPIYDVWVKECRKSFPGEEASDEAPAGSENEPTA